MQEVLTTIYHCGLREGANLENFAGSTGGSFRSLEYFVKLHSVEIDSISSRPFFDVVITYLILFQFSSGDVMFNKFELSKFAVRHLSSIQ